ncbi:MAG TPA: hypothetical protein VFS92_04165 [Planctomycetota bacterium]|nr:hypothetical protein [Planctomycetota bacterium]
MAPALAGDFGSRLVPSAIEILRAFVSPSLGFRLPAGLVTGLLIGGVFLVGTGMVVAAFGKRDSAKIWVPVGVAVGGILAGWALTGGRREVSTFFVVLALLLKFLGGLTFLVGLVRTPWIPISLVVAIVVGAAGWVSTTLLGTLVAAGASLLGAWSLFSRFERLSPGRRGSRWNQRTAAGWAVCLLAASTLEGEGLAGWGSHVKLAGIVVGGALLLLMPKALPKPAK